MEIKVGMYEWKQTEAPNSLTSGRLANCIAVGAIHKGRGYMAHEPSLYAYPKDYITPLDSILRQISEIPDKENIDIYVVGGAPMIPIQEQVLESRRIAMQKIQRYGLEGRVIETRWGVPKKELYLSLNLSENKVEITELPNARV